MIGDRLRIGFLVTHHPAGDERLKSLVDQNILPDSALDPDFRIGMIVDHKGLPAHRHWLIYSGNERVPAWYVGDELTRLS